MVIKHINKTRHKFSVRLRMSRIFSFRSPHKRVLFPGCSLSSGDSPLVYEVYEHLKKEIPDLGLWLNCCGMPAKKFAERKDFDRAKSRLIQEVEDGGITEIITACGNCFNTFLAIDLPSRGVKISSLYYYLGDLNLPQSEDSYVVHHPCSARGNQQFRQSFEQCVQENSIQLETTDKKHPLLCCLVRNESQRKRIHTIEDKNIITYCGHCTQQFQKKLPTKHILQVLFGKTTRMKHSNILASFRKLRKRFLQNKNME